MWSQFIDRRTRSARAVVVEISERGGARDTNFNAIEGVRASGPLREHRRRRRPRVLHVCELRAIKIAHDEVQVACERQKTCGRSLSVDGRGLSVPSLSRSPNAGALYQPTSMPSKGFAVPVLCTNTGAVVVPVFSM